MPERSREINSVATRVRSVKNAMRSEEHTSELQSPCNLVCRLLLEKKKDTQSNVAAHSMSPHSHASSHPITYFSMLCFSLLHVLPAPPTTIAPLLFCTSWHPVRLSL